MIRHQLPGSATNIASFLKEWGEKQECSGMWIAAAYATVSGVREVLESVRTTENVEFNFLIGLDDYVTQPGALELIKSLPGSRLRVASLSGDNVRFHPKLYYFQSNCGVELDLSIVGSSNLTHAALKYNCEVNSCVIGDHRRKQFFSVWGDLWSIGQDISDEILRKYADTYARVRRVRTIIERITKENEAADEPTRALESDKTEIDPAFAKTCWIEGGNITLMGRELEFKAEQALFFGLQSNGGDDKFFDFETSGGNIARLRMKYQGNHMWRLQMNDDVPEVKIGLRPKLPNGKLGRSPYVAVFQKTDAVDRYVLKFVELGSKEFRLLKRSSVNEGAIGRTSAREYGWF